VGCFCSRRVLGWRDVLWYVCVIVDVVMGWFVFNRGCDKDKEDVVML